MTASLAEAPPAGRAGGAGRPRWWRWVAVATVVAGVVGVLVAATQLIDGTTPARTTIDRATDPDGLGAFVLLLEAFDAEVAPVAADDLASADPDVVLALPGTSLDVAGRSRLASWVGSGGVLVDAAGLVPVAGTVPGLHTVVPSARLERGPACDVPALAEVDEVAAPGATWLLRPEPATTACFVSDPASSGIDGPGALLLAPPAGGVDEVIALADVSPFTNRYLDRADNAVLATALFAPRPGTRVGLLVGVEGLPTSEGVRDSIGTGGSDDREIGGDDQGGGGGGGGAGGDGGGSASDDGPSLVDALPIGVRFALLQLVLALGLYAWWRGRRVGAPVVEPQPVAIDGSELVLAVGDLLDRTDDPARAARVLRADAVARLARSLDLGGQATPAVVADAVARRTGHERDVVVRLLDGPLPPTRDGLVHLASQLDTLAQEVLRGVRT